MSKILIIDDDADIVEAMKVVLEAKDYKVISAESGQEGMNKVKQDKPDLIILDVMMESADKGFDVARELKQDKDYKDIPIVMLTAIKEKTSFDFKTEAGDETWLPVDDYCDKPINPEELIKKVDSFLRRK